MSHIDTGYSWFLESVISANMKMVVCGCQCPVSALTLQCRVFSLYIEVCFFIHKVTIVHNIDTGNVLFYLYIIIFTIVCKMEYVYFFCYVLRKSFAKMSLLRMHSLVRASLCALFYGDINNYVHCLHLFILNYFVANTYRYSKTKKFGIEPKIMTEINFYSKLYVKKKSHKLLLSLVLLAMLLKYSVFKIHIPIEYLISNNLIPK